MKERIIRLLMAMGSLVGIYGIIFLNLGLILLAAGLIAAAFMTFNSSQYGKVSGNSLIKTIRNKGFTGEYELFCELEKAGMTQLYTNVYLPTQTEGELTEVDIVGIHSTGIYVFEAKNYSGWIFGDEFGKNWTQMLNKHVKNSFPNPIRQNFGHIQALKTHLKFEEDTSFFSYVVFGDQSELKKINKKSEEMKVCLTKTKLVCTTVKADMERRTKLLSEREQLMLGYKLELASHMSDDTKNKHIESLRVRNLK